MHNQPREPLPYEDCQAKSIQEFGWTSQGMDWDRGQGIKSHHTQTCQGIWLQLSSEASYLVKETWASIPPQCHKLITSMPRRIETVSIEYIYSKWTYFPEGQQFTKTFFFYWSSILICWDSELVGFCKMWAKIITIKRTKDFRLCALNLFNTWVSQFELNYWNKWTFPRPSNLLKCTCISIIVWNTHTHTHTHTNSYL